MSLSVEIVERRAENGTAEVRIGNQRFIFKAADDTALVAKIQEYAKYHTNPANPNSLMLKQGVTVGEKKHYTYNIAADTLTPAP